MVVRVLASCSRSTVCISVAPPTGCCQRATPLCPESIVAHTPCCRGFENPRRSYRSIGAPYSTLQGARGRLLVIWPLFATVGVIFGAWLALGRREHVGEMVGFVSYVCRPVYCLFVVSGKMMMGVWVQSPVCSAKFVRVARECSELPVKR